MGVRLLCGHHCDYSPLRVPSPATTDHCGSHFGLLVAVLEVKPASSGQKPWGAYHIAASRCFATHSWYSFGFVPVWILWSFLLEMCFPRAALATSTFSPFTSPCGGLGFGFVLGKFALYSGALPQQPLEARHTATARMEVWGP